MSSEVSESIIIAAPPATVYAAVSDIEAMGRWSPEATGGTVRDGGPIAVGTRFVGRNRISPRRRWTTRCVVTAADPGRRFAFDVFAPVVGWSVATWGYDLEPTGDGGTRVTESWRDRRGGLMTAMSTLATGVRDRAETNRQNMKVTLERLKAELETA